MTIRGKRPEQGDAVVLRRDRAERRDLEDDRARDVQRPGAAPDVGEHPEMLPYSRDWFLRATCSARPIGPMRCSPEQRKRLHEVILDRTRHFRFPVVADMDFGHAAPQFTLPIGCRARIDATAQRFVGLEAAVH